MDLHGKKVLVSGASFAGLATAIWLGGSGCAVTVVDVAPHVRRGGTPVDLRGSTIAVVANMGLIEKVEAERLRQDRWEFKDQLDATVAAMSSQPDAAEGLGDVEIERDVFTHMLFDAADRLATFRFGTRIVALAESAEAVTAQFSDGSESSFDFVVGCDGIHSGVRKLAFGDEENYAHFLGQYFSITTVEKLLLPTNTGQIFNVPGKAVMVNSYNSKTDVVFAFAVPEKITYDYRDVRQQRALIREQFATEQWRVPELLGELVDGTNFYFDEFTQIKMPSWSDGRVVLVGDAAYCASPASGMGASLALNGAAVLAAALTEEPDLATAFAMYERSLRGQIDDVQQQAVDFGLDIFLPRTWASIEARNARMS